MALIEAQYPYASGVYAKDICIDHLARTIVLQYFCASDYLEFYIKALSFNDQLPPIPYRRPIWLSVPTPC